MKYSKIVKDNKLIITVPFFSYFLYVLFIWVCDAADFTCYLTGLSQVTILSRILALLLTGSVLVIAKRSFVIEFVKKQKVFYYLLLALFLYAIVISAVPNSEGDSWGLHFPNMFPGFYDNVNDSVFDKGGGSFIFALNDRVFYYFFVILGYRLSSLLNFVVIAISYGIVVEILKMLTYDNDGKRREEIALSNTLNQVGVVNFLLPEIFGFIIICTFYIMANIGIYMVEMIAIPFLLEMLRIIIFRLQNCDKSKISNMELTYFAAITGLVVAMKLTNIIFAIPFLILFLLIERKNIRIPIFLICAVIGALPAIPYMAYAYLSTGNPVFPFYNAIFKSPYWGVVSFKDGRWGPQNIIQAIFWPLQSVVNPTERLSEMKPICQYAMLLGMVSSGILFVKRKALNNSIYTILIIVFLVQMYLWIYTTGYGRYTVFLEILAGILVYCVLTNIKWSSKNIIPAILISALLLQSVAAAGQIVLGKGWSGKPSIIQQPTYYTENLPMLLKDRGLIGTDSQREKVDCFIQLNYFYTLDRLLNPDAEEFNMTYLHHPGFTIDKINPQYVQAQTDRLIAYQKEGKGIYSVIPNNHYHIIADLANSANAYIYDIEYLPSYFEPYYYMLLLKTGINEEKKNDLFYPYSPSKKFIIKNNGENWKFKGIVAITAHITKNYGETYFQIQAIDGKQTKIVYNQKVEPLNFYNMNMDLDLNGIGEDVEIVFKHLDAEGKEIPYGHLTILNTEIYQSK